jgi:hypothetical protein
MSMVHLADPFQDLLSRYYRGDPDTRWAVCGLWQNGESRVLRVLLAITGDPSAVTCGNCKRTDAWSSRGRRLLESPNPDGGAITVTHASIWDGP